METELELLEVTRVHTYGALGVEYTGGQRQNLSCHLPYHLSRNAGGGL